MTKKGYKNELLNRFKLIIYYWDTDKAIKYYKNDLFCHLYVICGRNKKYGCRKTDKQCKFEHDDKHSISKLVFSGTNSKNDLLVGKTLCQYLIYTKKYNKNSELFNKYGRVLDNTGKNEQDWKLSEKYYNKALSIDYSNSSCHVHYASLFEHRFRDNDKAEMKYKRALSIDPDNEAINYNFGIFLKATKKIGKKEYKNCLIYFRKVVDLDMKYSGWGYYQLAEVLYELREFEESIAMADKALEMHKSLCDSDTDNYSNNENSKNTNNTKNTKNTDSNKKTNKNKIKLANRMVNRLHKIKTEMSETLDKIKKSKHAEWIEYLKRKQVQTSPKHSSLFCETSYSYRAFPYDFDKKQRRNSSSLLRKWYQDEHKDEHKDEDEKKQETLARVGQIYNDNNLKRNKRSFMLDWLWRTDEQDLDDRIITYHEYRSRKLKVDVPGGLVDIWRLAKSKIPQRPKSARFSPSYLDPISITKVKEAEYDDDINDATVTSTDEISVAEKINNEMIEKNFKVSFNYRIRTYSKYNISCHDITLNELKLLVCGYAKLNDDIQIPVEIMQLILYKCSSNIVAGFATNNFYIPIKLLGCSINNSDPKKRSKLIKQAKIKYYNDANRSFERGSSGMMVKKIECLNFAVDNFDICDGYTHGIHYISMQIDAAGCTCRVGISSNNEMVRNLNKECKWMGWVMDKCSNNNDHYYHSLNTNLYDFSFSVLKAWKDAYDPNENNDVDFGLNSYYGFSCSKKPLIITMELNLVDGKIVCYINYEKVYSQYKNIQLKIKYHFYIYCAQGRQKFKIIDTDLEKLVHLQQLKLPV